MDAPRNLRKMKPVKLDFKNIADYRRSCGENQSEFWSRFGVTQSGGSRYEGGRGLPKPVRILVRLYADGTITDADLMRATGEKPGKKKTGGAA